ncbi:MAG: hypothetical protein CVU99_00830 [Firmicutes bacterium HGW-Firmicutes-4]|nr:MAG: hypothetical protein CVU99_00830 [Firmicutes bacterium HGW-Firmicutes-4]
MSNHEKPEPKIVNENPANNLNINEADSYSIDSDLIAFSINSAGTSNLQNSDSPGGNCPACGFPANQEPDQIRAIGPNLGICPECGHELIASDTGYFVVCADKKDPYDIAYQWIPAESTEPTAAVNDDLIPAAKKKLLKKIMSTNIIIKSLYFSIDTDKDKKDQKNNNTIKKKYFNKLLSLAQAGLTGTMATPELAVLALEQLNNEITTIEGQRIKNTYMKELGMRAFLSSLIALVLLLITSTAIISNQATLADLMIKKLNTVFFFQSDFLAVISMCSVIWIGAMLGTWVSFAARNPVLDFERLSILEKDRMKPTIRLIYIGICAIIFSLFLSTGIVALEVGDLSTANIKDSINTQFVIGILCGLTESKIGSFIHTKTATMLNSQTKALQPEEIPPAQSHQPTFAKKKG